MKPSRLLIATALSIGFLFPTALSGEAAEAVPTPVQVTPATPAKDPENGVRIAVTAKDYWVDTLLLIADKDIVRIAATGLWKANARQKFHTADGNKYVPTEDLADYFYNGPGGREGQLIGCLGKEGKPFVVGASFKETFSLPPGAGPQPLYLAFNGNPHGKGKSHEWGSHEGEQEVTIVIERFKSL